MNVGLFTKPNSKGQIVIPKKYRDELGIDEDILLNVMLQGRGIYIAPVDESVASGGSKSLFVNLLRKTAGSWAGDSWIKTEKKRTETEIMASRLRKKQW